MVFFFDDNTPDFSGKYSAVDVAQYLIQKCTLDGVPISNLQLQKILYYVQVYFLKKENRVLFEDDIEAWALGPVVRDVYMRYCGYGSAEIHEMEESRAHFTPNEKLAMDSIVKEKRAIKAWDLVNATHERGKPWDIVYKNGIGDKDIIPKAVIAKYA